MLFNLLDYHVKMDNQDVVLYYKGPFDDVILAKVSDHLQNTFSEEPKTGRKVFAAFIEMAQNIAFYSSERNFFSSDKNRGVGTFAIYEHDELLTLISGNVIKNEMVMPLIDRCETINQLDRTGLRELKRKWRSQGGGEDHKGGNIGLVQIALKSEHPLQIEMIEIDDHHSFFILSTEIDKVKKLEKQEPA